MKDWMDTGWLKFVEQHEIDTASMPTDELTLIKDAWLDGARKAVAEVRTVIDDTKLPR